ncbi:ABC transporter ATP-binding protein [Candidatus Pacearchaeota archaeon]|nr:ABC transporter ATP-binding protein [Candidatus Pacearchaeota archaeon]
MKIIEVKNLIKKFGKVTAVNNISFDVEAGSITGLLGPNGAGKTTTIQMMLNIITPSAGKILIFGKSLINNREEILNRLNFSSPYVTLPTNLTVWENLSTFARLYGIRDLRKRVIEVTKQFEISDMIDKLTGTLSTGQLTRLNLAKALLNRPSLLLLDEPTASLDPDIADRIRKMLKKLQKETDLTILYTSHNMHEIEEICNNVIFMNHGIITDRGTPKELIKKYGHSDLNEVFITLARKPREGEKKNENAQS